MRFRAFVILFKSVFVCMCQQKQDMKNMFQLDGMLIATRASEKADVTFVTSAFSEALASVLNY